MNDISEKIKSKTAAIKSIQNELEKNKIEASDARKAEQVCFLSDFLSFVVFVLYVWYLDNLCLLLHARWLRELSSCDLQEYIKEQEALIPLEQAARQQVAELVSVMESEKSQGSISKEILRAKETNQIKGIYGRMGDLGAIDGE